MEVITNGSKSITLYCDNRVEITYTRNPKYHDKSVETYRDKLQFHEKYYSAKGGYRAPHFYVLDGSRPFFIKPMARDVLHIVSHYACIGCNDVLLGYLWTPHFGSCVSHSNGELDFISKN